MCMNVFNNPIKTHKSTDYRAVTDESLWADYLRKLKMNIINIMVEENKNITWLSGVSEIDEEEIKEVLDFSEDIYISAIYEISKYLGYFPEIKLTKNCYEYIYDESDGLIEFHSVISKEEDMWKENKEENEFSTIGIE